MFFALEETFFVCSIKYLATMQQTTVSNLGEPENIFIYDGLKSLLGFFSLKDKTK
jgi:hypothetical protein